MRYIFAHFFLSTCFYSSGIFFVIMFFHNGMVQVDFKIFSQLLMKIIGFGWIVCCVSLTSDQIFPDCLRVTLLKIVTVLFVTFYNQQEILRAYSTNDTESPPQTPMGLLGLVSLCLCKHNVAGTYIRYTTHIQKDSDLHPKEFTAF